MKKAGIPEYIAKKYFYTLGKRDNIPPCNCLNHPLFVADNSAVLPLPEIGSGLFAAGRKEKSQRANALHNKTGKNSMLTYCVQTVIKPATGIHLSNIHFLVLSSEMRRNTPFAFSVPDT